MWILVQHRLNGTLLGAVPSETSGFERLDPGARIELGARSWRIRGRFVQGDDGPTLVLVDAADGGADTAESMFHTPGDDPAPPAAARPFLDELEHLIEARKQSTAVRSYTRTLLDGGAARIGDKVREEADEVARALGDESDERVTSEAADLLFHLLVGLSSRDLSLSAVVAVLARRFGVSGHVEKASRAPSPI